MNSKVHLNRQTVVRLALVGIIPLILFFIIPVDWRLADASTSDVG